MESKVKTSVVYDNSNNPYRRNIYQNGTIVDFSLDRTGKKNGSFALLIPPDRSILGRVEVDTLDLGKTGQIYKVRRTNPKTGLAYFEHVFSDIRGKISKVTSEEALQIMGEAGLNSKYVPHIKFMPENYMEVLGKILRKRI